MSVNERESLTPKEERILGNKSFYLMLTAGVTSIAVFSLGADLLGKINLYQALLAVVIGLFVASVIQALNGRAGQKYGIPAMVQLRSSYGTKGSVIPGIIRIMPALIYFGFQSWIGAEAINYIVNLATGFDSVVTWFIIFHGTQIVLAMYGFRGFKWVNDIGAVVVLIALGYMLYYVLNTYGFAIADDITNFRGSWGVPFVAAIIVMAGNSTAVAINYSDLTRNFKKEPGSAHLTALVFLGSTPPMVLMALIGLIVAGGTGSFDPIGIFSDSVTNPILLVITLLFIIFSQLTTNIVSNIVPPVYFLMDALKLNYRKSMLLVGVLPLFTFPWKLVSEESASGLTLFVQIFSSFVGPVFTIMLVDYYIIRKRKLDLSMLYDPKGPFKGWNSAAIIATVVGTATGLLFIEYSWLISIIPSAVIYYILMRYMKSNRRFLAGTEMQLTSSISNEEDTLRHPES